MARVARLSELEGCVLGLVWALGPCSAYPVRRSFLESPSSRWSGSAGAIYPLMMRLEKRGLLRSKAQATGRREGRHYQITKCGRQRLVAWMSPPFAPDVVEVPSDPLRTRLGLLDVLTAEGKRAFLEQSEAAIREQIARAEAECRRNRREGKQTEYLVARGALLSARARWAWIKECRDHWAPS